jgi:hypothetical protein
MNDLTEEDIKDQDEQVIRTKPNSLLLPLSGNAGALTTRRATNRSTVSKRRQDDIKNTTIPRSSRRVSQGEHLAGEAQETPHHIPQRKGLSEETTASTVGLILL